MIVKGDKVKIDRGFYRGPGQWYAPAWQAKNKILTVVGLQRKQRVISPYTGRQNGEHQVVDVYDDANNNTFTIDSRHLKFVRRHPKIQRNAKKKKILRASSRFNWTQDARKWGAFVESLSRRNILDNDGLITEISKLKAQQAARREIVHKLALRIHYHASNRRELAIFRAPVENKISAALRIIKSIPMEQFAVKK